MSMPHPDRHPLGTLANHGGQPETPFIDCDGLDLSGVSVLLPAAVRALEKGIAEYWTRLAAFRLRAADLSAIDVHEARESLVFFSLDRRDLAAVDWAEVGRRLDAMRRYGGDVELRKLYALLMADEPPATEAEDGPLCAGCGDPAGTDATPIENGGVICKLCAAALYPVEGEGSDVD